MQATTDVRLKSYLMLFPHVIRQLFRHSATVAAAAPAALQRANRSNWSYQLQETYLTHGDPQRQQLPIGAEIDGVALVRTGLARDNPASLVTLAGQ
jgi:hypothetical protein